MFSFRFSLPDSYFFAAAVTHSLYGPVLTHKKEFNPCFKRLPCGQPILLENRHHQNNSIFFLASLHNPNRISLPKSTQRERERIVTNCMRTNTYLTETEFLSFNVSIHTQTQKTDSILYYSRT